MPKVQSIAELPPAKMLDSEYLVIKQLSTAIILCQQSGVILQANPSAENLLGVSLRAGDNLFERVPNSTKTNNIIFDCAVNPDSENGLVILELHDRQRHKHIREENDLWEQQSITKKITRQLAHEIKNPLAGIRGAAQLLEKQLDDKQKRFTQLVISEVDRLAMLADNLLGPVKTLKKRTHNIHASLQHALQLVDSDGSHKTQIKRDFDPSLPEINIDRNQLIQVFLNLSRNAVQVMQEHKVSSPTLTIQTRILNQYTIGKERHKLVLAIRFIDNGPGVPRDIEEHLFYPLVTNRAAGTGLGLSISQLLVQRHEGLIEYRRDTKTNKTEFTILLPYLND